MDGERERERERGVEGREEGCREEGCRKEMDGGLDGEGLTEIAEKCVPRPSVGTTAPQKTFKFPRPVVPSFCHGTPPKWLVHSGMSGFKPDSSW